MSLSTPNSPMTLGSGQAANSAIARELHQTAQPLTVLQGLLELALLSSCSAEEYRGVIQRAMEQSRRISDGFNQVRKLVHFSASSSHFMLAADETQRIEPLHV